MAKAKRTGNHTPDPRTTILDATIAIMLETGYAAVSARRVASKAGVKPSLLQYYFPTMDELLLAVFRRAAGEAYARHVEARDSSGLRALWGLTVDSHYTALGIEFMALANHNKLIKAEMVKFIKRSRRAETETLARLLEGKLDDPDRYPPNAVSFILGAIRRGFVSEQGLGVHVGHAETRAIVEHWIDRLTKAPKAKRRRSA